MATTTMKRPAPSRPGMAGVLACALGLSLVLSSGVRAASSNWPRQFDSPSGSFIIYQPQPEALNGDMLSGRAAFSLQRTADAEPVFGVIWYAERIQIDRDSSTVDARDFDVTKVRLPGITPSDASRYEQLVESEALHWDLSGSLEELQAGLASAERERASVADLDTLPPHIMFLPERAILVVYDGDPIFEPVSGSGLERAANTPYAVVHDRTSDRYYLNGANLWYSAKNPLGPWTVEANPPGGVQQAVPPDTTAGDQVQGPPPRVITATEPTELISTDGPPQYAPLVEGELLYVTNTESDVVREISTESLYVLLAGRWYKGHSQAGPWTFVRGDRMPSSFSRIPPASPKANLLASISGTDQADDAVADAEIPQTSAIRRDDAGFAVRYDGSPEFETIPGTYLKYAVNTDAEVLLADGRYYACDQGVWYVAGYPDGPWRVSDVRPEDLDEIPPSCPVYDVRYVYIYDVTPDVVYVGYLPGYLGCYPYYGTVVFGTGYRYRAWRRHYYYPRPCTWGYAPRYNPWLSRWSFGSSYEMGFLRVGFSWHSGPRYRETPPPPRWLGAGGYRRPLLEPDRTMARTRRPSRTPVQVAERSPMNLYRRPVNAPRVDRTATRTPVTRVGGPPPGPVRVPNDVFAGRDGKVYRRDQGGWKVNQGRSWLPAPVPATPAATPATRPSYPEPPRVERNWPPSPSAAPRPMTPPPPSPQRPMTPPPARPPAAQGAPRTMTPPPPAISPTPGNLEREFRGRSRSGAGITPAHAPQPQPKEREKEKKAEERKG
jgi:hypothetical protein